MSKRYFYCWYLGFTEVNGLIGQQYVIDGIQKLTTSSRLLNQPSSSNANTKRVASKVTLSLNETSFTLIGSNSQQQQQQQQQPVYIDSANAKSYTIDYENISYITRLNDASKNSDIVAIITVNTGDESLDEFYHKKHPYRHIANLHAFKFDSTDSAKRLEKYLNEYYFNYRQKSQNIQFVNYNNNKTSAQIQGNNQGNRNSKNVNMKNLMAHKNAKSNIITTNKVGTSTLNSGGTTTASSSNESEYGGQIENDYAKKRHRHLSPQQQRQNNALSPRAKSQQPASAAPIPPYKPIDDITKEFKRKLFSEEPLLLPPKDYNTVMRSRGDLEKAELRRSLNEHIVGRNAVETRPPTLEKIDENLQVNTTTSIMSPRSAVMNASRMTDDDDMSIDEEAKRAISYYDSIVNSILTQPAQPVNTTNANVFRFEPPTSSNANNGHLVKLAQSNDLRPSSISPAFNLSHSENIKMNPLHIIDEEYTGKTNFNRILNQFKSPVMSNNLNSSNVYKPTPAAAIPPTAQSTPSLATPSFSSGFRSNALTKLGNYAPRAIPKPPLSSSTDELSKSSGNYYNNHNNRPNNYSSKQFSSSLPTEQFHKLQQQQQQYYKMNSSRVAKSAVYEEPEIDYDTIDNKNRHSDSHRNRQDSQFILKPPTVNEQLFTKVNKKNIKHSTPTYDNSFYSNQQLLAANLYADVYY